MRYVSWVTKVIMNIWTCVVVYDWQVNQNVDRTYYLLIISRIAQVYSDLGFMASCLITGTWIDKDLKTTSLSLLSCITNGTRFIPATLGIWALDYIDFHWMMVFYFIHCLFAAGEVKKLARKFDDYMLKGEED